MPTPICHSGSPASQRNIFATRSRLSRCWRICAGSTPTPPRCRDTHADAQARAIRKLREREERHATELAVAQHQLRKATEKATALQVRFANKQARDAAERIFRKPFSG